jgi:glycosyltransferase involved in cell wall biosynthesis
MLLAGWAVLRQRGWARSLQIIRDLVAAQGVWAALCLIFARLGQTRSSTVFNSGPIAQLVKADLVSRRSVGRLPGILLIGSLDLPQCRKYRVIQKQEMIECALGVKVTVADYRKVQNWLTQMQYVDKVILYRIPDRYRSDQIINEARRLGLTLCYDIDDAVFDLESVRSNPNFPYLPRRIRKGLCQDAVAFSETMAECDLITVSTAGLQKLVEQRFHTLPCHILPNGVDAETIHYGGIARQQAAERRKGPFRILIASGSLAHEADTNVAMNGVRLFLRRSPESEIIMVGSFNGENALPHTQRVTRFGFLPYSEYLRVLATADCVLVPLAESAFNNGKSIVRLIDATEVGVPVIGSSSGEYSEPGLRSTFLPAHSPSEWCTALETVAAWHHDPSRMLAAAQDRVRTPRLLHSLWRDLDPELKTFYGDSGSRSAAPTHRVAESLCAS